MFSAAVVLNQIYDPIHLLTAVSHLCVPRQAIGEDLFAIALDSPFRFPVSQLLPPPRLPQARAALHTSHLS